MACVLVARGCAFLQLFLCARVASSPHENAAIIATQHDSLAYDNRVAKYMEASNSRDSPIPYGLVSPPCPLDVSITCDQPTQQAILQFGMTVCFGLGAVEQGATYD